MDGGYEDLVNPEDCGQLLIESVNLKNLVEGPRLYETTLIDAVDCIMES